MSDMSLTDGQFSMGRVVSQTFGIIGRNLVSIGVIAFVVAVLIAGLSIGTEAMLPTMFPGSSTVSTAGIVGGVVAIVSLLVRPIATGAITHIAVCDLNGQRTDIGSAFATGLRVALPVLGLSIVMGLGIGLATLLLVVPGIMLAMRWLVAVPARVVEGPPMGSALARSSELTKGNRWKLFGLAVVAGLLALLVSYLIGRVGGALGVSAGGGAAALLAGGIVQVIVSVITTSISATGYAVCYMELRRVREGATPSQLAAVFA